MSIGSASLYCLKEKKMTPSVNVVEFTAKNGRKMLKGKCSSCGRGQSKIIG